MIVPPAALSSADRMPFSCLSDFLAALQDDGDLVRVETPVDPVYELAELTRQVALTPGGGPALLFADVRGSELPAVSNLLGSERRLCRALDAASFDAAAARLAAALRPPVSEGWMQSLGRWPQFSQLAGCAPRIIKTGACQQVVYLGSDVALSDLPIPHCWPGETGRSITAAQVYLKDPDTGARHVGLYSLSVIDDKSLAIAWNEQQEGWQIARRYREATQQTPLAVVVGGDPLIGYSAGAPIPAGTDGLIVAGLLRGDGVELVRGRTVELEVPADAEVVIEGYLDADEPAAANCAMATPFGHIRELGDLPVMRVTAVTRRANPVFPIAVSSAPPSEAHVQRKLSERLALPLLRLLLPEIEDVNFPQCGGVQQIVFVSIHKRFPHHARQVIATLSGQRWCLGTKMIVAVDADVDVQDEHQVWYAVSTNMHAARDAFMLEGPGATDDPAASTPGLGSLLGIDATRKRPAELESHAWPSAASASTEVQRRVAEMCRELGFKTPPVTVSK